MKIPTMEERIVSLGGVLQIRKRRVQRIPARYGKDDDGLIIGKCQRKVRAEYVLSTIWFTTSAILSPRSLASTVS